MSQKINIIAVVNEPTEVAFDKLHKVLSDFGYYISSYNPKSGLVEFSAWVYKVSTMCRQTDNQRTEITFVCEHSASSEINKQGCYQLIENISKAYNDKSDKSKSLVVQLVDGDMPQNIAYDTNSYNMQRSNENEFRAIFIGLLLVIVGIISILFATGTFSGIISSSPYNSQSNSSSSSYSSQSDNNGYSSKSQSGNYNSRPSVIFRSTDDVYRYVNHKTFKDPNKNLKIAFTMPIMKLSKTYPTVEYGLENISLRSSTQAVLFFRSTLGPVYLLLDAESGTITDINDGSTVFYLQ